MNQKDKLYSIYKENIEYIDDPTWGKKHVHDFERYIPDEWREVWDDLSWEIRTAMYISAQEAADMEVWD